MINKKVVDGPCKNMGGGILALLFGLACVISFPKRFFYFVALLVPASIHHFSNRLSIPLARKKSCTF